MGKNILLFDHIDSGWMAFFSEYFEDTASKLHFFYEASKAGTFLDSAKVDLAFINTEFVSLPLAQKLKVLKQSHPDFKIFHLGPVSKPVSGLEIDEVLLEPHYLAQFQKQLIQHIKLPEKIKILLVDDEAEVARVIRDYFEDRSNPSFEISYAENGQEGLRILEKKTFDVIILDIKMPILDGRAVYREIVKRGIKTPVIIFFDAIFGDEVVEIHQIGRPAIMEKGSTLSAMPEIAALVKKMIFFG